jgi:hypothetical protein
MIHVIATSANIENNYAVRKQQYLTGLCSVISNYKINPYIIETCSPTNYLAEHFVGHSNYSENKGISEFINIDNFFKNTDLKLKEDDVIIKTSLRYEIVSPHLLNVIKSNDHEVYCKSSSDIYGPQDTGVHCFLFAMKYKCWKNFLNTFDRHVHRDQPIEGQLADYFKKTDTKYLDKLGILANPANHNKIYTV